MNSSNKKFTGCETCRRIWNWFWQLTIWVGWILLIVAFALNSSELKVPSIIIICISYLIYLINAFCSATFGYLRNKHKANSIHDHMRTLFYTPAHIKFNIECYHTETRTHTTTNSRGEAETRTETVTVTTYRGSEDFRYYSWRDISGLFLLDSHKVMTKRKVYIKLELELDIQFADEMTRYDYERQKSAFIEQNKWRDTHYRFSESRELASLKKYNLVRIDNKPVHCVNICCYVLFTIIIPLVEFYKMYINSYCLYQNYVVRKVVSTRYNINMPKYSEQYQPNVPQLTIYESIVVYDETPANLHESPELPTENEIEESKRLVNNQDQQNSNNIISISINSEQNIINTDQNNKQMMTNFDPAKESNNN